MPKPKSKKAEPTFLTHAHSLSAQAQKTLLELLGYGDIDLTEESVRHQLPGMKILEKKPGAPLLLQRDPTSLDKSKKTDIGKALLEVEQWLGFYVNGAHNLDEVPRPADYVRAFKPIESRAMKLYESLCGLGGYFSGQFALKGADQDSIEAALVELMRVSGAVVKDFEGLPSKGAKKNNALAEVVRRLRIVFRKYYRGPMSGRKKSGAFEYRAPEEKQELRFVETALRDARIISRSYDDLPRLFRDPRCATPDQRDATIKRIAAKVNRQRGQKTHD